MSLLHTVDDVLQLLTQMASAGSAATTKKSAWDLTVSSAGGSSPTDSSLIYCTSSHLWSCYSCRTLYSYCQIPLQRNQRKDGRRDNNNTEDRRTGQNRWDWWGQIWQTEIPERTDSSRFLGPGWSGETQQQVLPRDLPLQQKKWSNPTSHHPALRSSWNNGYNR